MKTTVKLSPASSVTVAPMGCADALTMHIDIACGNNLLDFVLTPDQAGALIFGIEQALEVIDQRHKAALQTMRAAA